MCHPTTVITITRFVWTHSNTSCFGHRTFSLKKKKKKFKNSHHWNLPSMTVTDRDNFKNTDVRMVLIVFDIQEPTFSSGLSEEWRVTSRENMMGSWWRKQIKAWLMGCGSGGAWLLAGIKPVWAACFHEAATVSVCLGEEELTDTLPFVSSIERAPQCWKAASCSPADFRPSSFASHDTGNIRYQLLGLQK